VARPACEPTRDRRAARFSAASAPFQRRQAQSHDGSTEGSKACGDAHSLALTSTGKDFAWGLNASGELGNGTTTDSSLPVRVKLPAGTVPTAFGAGPVRQFSLSIVPSPPT
jgi:hypothetical protein